MSNGKLAIFDFDGTIADSLEWSLSVLSEVARRYGFRQITIEQREMLRGRPNQEILAYLGIPMWKLPLIARGVRKIAARDVGQIRAFPWVQDCRLDAYPRFAYMPLYIRQHCALHMVYIGPYRKRLIYSPIRSATMLLSLDQQLPATVAPMSNATPPRAPKKLHPVNIRMDEAMLNRLRSIADEEDRTVSNLVGRIIKEWLAARDAEG
jgi:hypothetical protein